MIHRYVVVFLFLASLFTATHIFALAASLYWYYWWFDVVMHFWGGALISLGVYALSTFSQLHFQPTLRIVLLVLLVATIAWEVFELLADLWQPTLYVIDTIQDIILGFGGGLLAHGVLRAYTMR